MNDTERIAELEVEVERLRRQIDRFSRIMKRTTDHWMIAAELALNGNSQLLRNKVEMLKMPPVEIMQSVSHPQ